MATPHDDPEQQRHPDPRKQEPKKETDLAKEGEHVIDADVEVFGQEAGPLTNPRQTGPATWIAPFQEDAAEADAPKKLPPPPPGGYTNFPSLSLDEPHPPAPRAEVVEEAAEVLDDEPVPAEPASTASSAVHVAEVVDDSADDDVEVLRDEPRGGSEESSVVDISALVDEGASNVVEDVTPGSSSVLADSAVVVDSPLEPTSAAESSAILAEPASEIAHDIWADASEVPTPRPANENVPVTPPPAMPHFDDSPAHAADEVLGGDADDLDSAVLVDPSSVAQVKTEISQPFPVASHNEPEPDINWDDITAAGDSKVARSGEDDAKTQLLAGEKTPRPANPVSHDSDVIADEAVVAQADSGAVELGGQSAAQPPIAGVDPVAEALESGVNIQKPSHADKPPAPQEDHTELDISQSDGSDSVFDEDILADANPPSAAAEQVKSADDEAAALFADESGNTPKPAPATHADAAKEIEFDDDAAKGDVADAMEADDLAALAFTDETHEAAAKTGADTDDMVDLGAAAIADQEVPPAVPAKKERKKEPQLVGAGAGKSGRGWLTGMLASLLILGGAAAAVWYVKPDLLEQVSKSSPNAAAPKKEQTKVEPPATRARARMDNQQYDQALTILNDAPKTPVNLATRAEARWLKYLQTQAAAQKPLDRDAPEVKQVLADLKGADNDLLTMQVTKALDSSKLRADLAASEKNLAMMKAKIQEVQANKVQPNKGPPDKAKPDKLPGGQQLGPIADALVKAKIWESKDKVDLAALQKALKNLSDSRSSLAAVNKLLDEANVGAAADQGVAMLIAAKKEVDGKLALVNKLLTDDKIKGDGVKGLEELIAARDKLAKERTDLHEAIQAAYKELTDANQPPAGTDPRAALEEAVKIARKKSDTPPAPERRGSQQTEAGRPNPLLAEQFFDKGLQLFWSQDYAAAEAKFRKAVAFYGQDARYQYFLGMSLLAQGDNSKRKVGYDAFEKASRLEAANRPSMDEVNGSLERIQGSMRALVNAYRQKALLAAQ